MPVQRRGSLVRRAESLVRRTRRSRQRGAQLENVDSGASFFAWGNASPDSMVDFWEKSVLGKSVENPPVSDFIRFDGTE